MSKEFPEEPITKEQSVLKPLESTLGRLDKVAYEHLSPEQSEQILSHTEIHGSSLNGRQLTIEDLRSAGLAPHIRIHFGQGVSWSASSEFRLDNHGRLALIAYIETEGKTIARSFYLSKSQVLWRYLPQYWSDAENRIRWFSKWLSEQSISAPFSVQEVLVKENGRDILTLDDPYFFFGGTARSIDESAGTIDYKVDTHPQHLDSNSERTHTADGSIVRIAPDKLGEGIESAMKPEFLAEPLASWEMASELYGKIKCEIFQSQDGLLRYLFCQDSLGRAWLGGVENSSPVQSVGVRKFWVQAGDLTTPAFEYKKAAGDKYGNPKIAKQDYVDMFEKYICHIPLIRDYLRNVLSRTKDTKAIEVSARSLIEAADSFDDLYATLRSIPVITSLKYVSAAQAIEEIERARSGQMDKFSLSTWLGLRKKVFSLLALEHKKEPKA